jgi:hypothetical protein
VKYLPVQILEAEEVFAVLAALGTTVTNIQDQSGYVSAIAAGLTQ